MCVLIGHKHVDKCYVLIPSGLAERRLYRKKTKAGKVAPIQYGDLTKIDQQKRKQASSGWVMPVVF